ncbi:MAG: tetratricopeptide repeat protein, partial [Rudaea sp.]
MLTTQQRLAGLPLGLARQTASIAQLIDQGRLSEAGPAVSAAMKQASGHPEVLRLAGILRIAQGHAEEAVTLLSQARQLQSRDPLVHFALARAYELVHDRAQALASMRQACVEGPELADCWYALGRMLFDSGQLEAGIGALRHALTLAPDHANARTLLATILNLDGHSDQAQQEYRQILARSAHSGAAWWGLATLKPMPLTDSDIAELQRILQQPQLEVHERVPMGFALAQALEYRGDYAQALQTLRD